ncbi:hypothetical protein DL93DRAFT_928453 [Clavulina sp. PMI_390]|nr:hypothetical protein DL93DRAFT_928453 [Clavulina sp. PMI_390]
MDSVSNHEPSDNSPVIQTTTPRLPPDIIQRRAKNSLRPINRAPFDILAAIFELACHQTDDSMPRIETKTQATRALSHTLYTISMICHSWRATVLRIPILWRNIPQILRPQEHGHIQLLDIHCSRARSYPLRVCTSIGIPEDLDPIVQTLAQRNCVLDALDVSIAEIPEYTTVHLCEPQFCDVVGRLSRLYLRFWSDRIEFLEAIDLTGALELIDLRIWFPEGAEPSDGWEHATMPRLLNAPPHLQSFYLVGTFDTQDIRMMLEACAESLEHFFWDSSDNSDLPPITSQDYSIHLPRLTSLLCHGITANILLIHIVTSERLKTLKFGTEDIGFFDPPDHNPQQGPTYRNTNIFAKKIPSLRNLMIDWGTDSSVYPYLRAQTEIETLCIELQQLRDLLSTPQAQLSQEWDRTLFPNLRQIYIFVDTAFGSRPATLTALLEMSASRVNPFIIFVKEDKSSWWDPTGSNMDEDLLAVWVKHKHLLQTASWDHLSRNFDMEKVCDSFGPGIDIFHLLSACSISYLSHDFFLYCFLIIYSCLRCFKPRQRNSCVPQSKFCCYTEGPISCTTDCEAHIVSEFCECPVSSLYWIGLPKSLLMHTLYRSGTSWSDKCSDPQCAYIWIVAVFALAAYFPSSEAIRSFFRAGYGL